jgi:tetratricopeptide (TPR) repeat protein
MEDHEKALCRDVLSLTGRKLVKEHFFALAGDALHMSLMYDEESSILWADVGFTQYSIGKLEIAKMCFDNAKKYDPENFVLPEDIRAALEDVGENVLLQQHDEIKQAKKKRKEEEEDEEEEGDIGESIRIKSSSSSSSHSSSEHRPEL